MLSMVFPHVAQALLFRGAGALVYIDLVHLSTFTSYTILDLCMLGTKVSRFCAIDKLEIRQLLVVKLHL